MIKLPAYLIGYNRKADRSCSVRFETQELSTLDLIELDKHYQAFGWLLFQENPISDANIPKEPAIDGDKTPAERLRAVLFILWKQRGENGDFEAFYRLKMDKIIFHLKSKLD